MDSRKEEPELPDFPPLPEGMPPFPPFPPEDIVDPQQMGPEGFRRKHMEDIGFIARLIHDYIDREINNQMKPYDITMSQSKILMFLRSRIGRKTTQKEIEDFLGVSHPTTVGLLKRLETKGFIYTETDPEDHRMKLVVLTEKDQELGRRMYECRLRTDKSLTAGMTEEEVQELKRLMGKVRDNIFRELKK